MLLSATLAAAPVLAADASNMAKAVPAWEKAYNADDLKAIAALYSDDGCRMPPNARTAKGTEGIIAQIKAGKDQGAAKVKLTLTVAETSGHLGYSSGTYEVLGADGKQVDQGKWMNYTKKSKGKWKIHCDIWNSDLPLPAAKAK
jgi:ketosteroid isomerase-like protein